MTTTCNGTPSGPIELVEPSSTIVPTSVSVYVLPVSDKALVLRRSSVGGASEGGAAAKRARRRSISASASLYLAINSMLTCGSAGGAAGVGAGGAGAETGARDGAAESAGAGAGAGTGMEIGAGWVVFCTFTSVAPDPPYVGCAVETSRRMLNSAGGVCGRVGSWMGGFSVAAATGASGSSCVEGRYCSSLKSGMGRMEWPFVVGS
jgi:hypothetical protein